ncbi:MAG TPA: hypothetical protein VM681_04155 [Candidatus Thermoplasmatota archaeon]|nr:hypothetical protein [Candidatus Thermoplasmatota archaeon]
MRSRVALLAPLVLVLAGCAAQEPVHPDLSRAPAGTPGKPLVAYMSEGTHGRGSGVYLYVNASDPGPAPATCVAYRANATKTGYTCRVDGPTPYVGDRGTVPWTIRAFWDDYAPGATSVFAYDAQNRPVAWWRGATETWAGYITE